MVKVLIVDDSPTIRKNLEFILSSDKEIEIIGTAENGKKALEFVENNRPDIITMDIEMPEMDGFEATKRIMQKDPIPIIIVTASTNLEWVRKSFLAIEIGALTILPKPVAMGSKDFLERSNELLHCVKIFATEGIDKQHKMKTTQAKKNIIKDLKQQEQIDIIVIAASSGGPAVLEQIIPNIPQDFKTPILIVQHIAHGFIEGMVDWLDKMSNINIQLARDKATIMPRTCYFAPDNKHMILNKNKKIALIDGEPVDFACPSATMLFSSAAEHFGKRSIGILLTGMGKDGAQGLKAMRDSGALTMAQSQETSLVFGMPETAIKLGAVSKEMSPGDILEYLKNLHK